MLIDILRRQQIKNKLALYIPDDLKYEISSKTGDKKVLKMIQHLIQLPKGNFSIYSFIYFRYLIVYMEQ